MPVSHAVPADHPLMIAWNAYAATEDYANTLHWAQTAYHTQTNGALWSAFGAGFRAGAASDDGVLTSTIGERVLPNTSSLLPEGRGEQEAEKITKALNQVEAMNAVLEEIDALTAKGAEFDRIAATLGEVDDPFAAWETLDLIIAQHGAMRTCLAHLYVEPDLAYQAKEKVRKVLADCPYLPAKPRERERLRAEKAEADLSAARLRIKALEEERATLRLAAKLYAMAVNFADVVDPAVQVAGEGLRSALSPSVSWAELFSVLSDGVSPSLIADALLSSAQGETKEGFDGLPELPCGEQPGAAVGATAALATWRSINSAPKDGTPILAWCVHPHARHATDDKDWCAPVVTQWIDHNGGGWTWNGMAGTFTHWMPLPDGPDAALVEGE